MASPFGDHAVLQRDQPVAIWGMASPNENITVRFQGQSATGTATADGTWRIALAPMRAETRGTDLRIEGSTTEVFHDVVVGDVWLCSGQSNMTFTVDRAANAAAEIAAADFPEIRQLTVAQTVADQPAGSVSCHWQNCSPQTVGEFSAVGYFFAREIYGRTHVPIGIVCSAWGATPIESWLSPAVLQSEPAFAVAFKRWQRDRDAYPANKTAYEKRLAQWQAGEATAKAAGRAEHQAYLKLHSMPGLPGNMRPSSGPGVLYNGMIHPLLPYALRGFLWYQGESNASRASEYRALFAALITSWREAFHQTDAPFYWVNLANFRGFESGTAWASLREAQTQTLSLPATGQALAIDIGDPAEIHPANKQEVGRRLALLAKHRVYHLPGEDVGPTFAGMTIAGHSVRVTLSHTSGGLKKRGDEVQELEVAGADRKFHAATARIEGDALIVYAAEVESPVAVRYAWRNAPAANLYNSDDLPAVPFRSDNW